MKLFLTGLLCLLSFWGQAKTPTVITDLQDRRIPCKQIRCTEATGGIIR
ncbi:hypothetical protein [Providencia alcalifaciens]